PDSWVRRIASRVSENGRPRARAASESGVTPAMRAPAMVVVSSVRTSSSTWTTGRCWGCARPRDAGTGSAVQGNASVSFISLTLSHSLGLDDDWLAHRDAQSLAGRAVTNRDLEQVPAVHHGDRHVSRDGSVAR